MQRRPLPARCIEKFPQALVEVAPPIRLSGIATPFAHNLREPVRDWCAAITMPIRRHKYPAAWSQNSCELPMRPRPVEPVHRPADRNQIDRRLRQRGRLGLSLDNLQRGLSRGQRPARLQHLPVRLDCDHAMPSFKKDVRQHSRACANICDDCALLHRAVIT